MNINHRPEGQKNGDMKDELKVNAITWQAFSTEVGDRLKNYFLITPSKSQVKTVKSMWRKGHSVSDAVSYILLSSNPIN